MDLNQCFTDLISDTNVSSNGESDYQYIGEGDLAHVSSNGERDYQYIGEGDLAHVSSNGESDYQYIGEGDLAHVSSNGERDYQYIGGDLTHVSSNGESDYQYIGEGNLAHVSSNGKSDYQYIGEGDLALPVCQIHHSCSSKSCDDQNPRFLCFCTPSCKFFNDCCVDHLLECPDPHSTTMDKIMKKNTDIPRDFQCVDPTYSNDGFTWGFKMIATCDSRFRGEKIEWDCVTDNRNDTYASIPVMDEDGFHFKNIYCALCNNRDIYDVIPWSITFHCSLYESSSVELYLADVTQILHYTTTQCNPEYIPPYTVDAFDVELYRECLPHTIDETQCHSSHPAFNLCASYIAQIQANVANSYEPSVFKNPHCLMCFLNLTSLNGTEYADMICELDAFPGYGWWAPDLIPALLTVPISVFFDFGRLSQVHIIDSFEYEINKKITECSIGQTYDPFQSKCLQLSCLPGMHLENNQCIYRYRSNVECNNTTDRLTMTTTITSPNEENIHRNGFLCLNSFYQLFSVEFEQNATNITINNNSEHLIMTTVVPAESWKMVESTLDHHIGSLVVGHKESCNVSEIQVDVTCIIDDMSDICSEGWYVKNDTLTYNGSQINLASRHAGMLLEYTRSKDGFFEKNTFEKWCLNHPKTLTCPFISLEHSLFRNSSLNSSWIEYIPTGMLVSPDEYIIISPHEIQICSKHVFPKNHPILKRNALVFTFEHRIVSFIGAILSLLGCSISFLTICLFKSLRNRVTPLLLNFIVALFIAEFLLITGGHQTLYPRVCAFVAIFLHYIWLSTFSWMNILGFDLFLSFGTSERLSVPQRVETKSLCMYVAFGWGFPLLIVIPTLFLHLCQCTNLHVYYGDETACWISDGLTNLVVFGVPAALMIVVNAGFYIGIVWGICKSRSIDVNNVNDQTRFLRAREKRNMWYLLIYVKVTSSYFISLTSGSRVS